MNSRIIIQNFMELSKKTELTPEIKGKIDEFLKRFPRNDLRKKATKLRLWKFLDDLRGYDVIQDPIDGIMADLAEKWGRTLGKALREQKIS
ncbi:MAG: hypothetical protein ACFFDN_41280 [Candidatus Hodarchaeota archaeon]